MENKINTFNIFKLKFISFLMSNRQIRIDKILIGQQSGFPLERWVEISKEYERISIPMTNSPYVLFLKEVEINNKLLTSDKYLENTDYFKMAIKCISIVGHFMGAKDNESLKEWMRKYYSMFENAKKGINNSIILSTSEGHSKPNSPVLLYKLKHSDCYEIVDGHHRIAIQYALGNEYIEGKIVGNKYSILQKKLLKINQVHDIELYQPVERLEVRNWPKVRNCQDRYNMMINFIKNKIKKGSVLDLACSYGWFLSKFKEKGFKVLGIDRDEKAIEIARLIYGLNDSELETIKIEDFFKKNTQQFDIVLFLSILHHYAIGKEKGEVIEILKNLDKITGKILFLDTGQNHEQWFKENLKEWDENYIVNLIKQNTSFKEVIPLGKDNDNTGKYKNNYARTLFACVK